MGLDVYFRRDIANILRATAATNLGAMNLSTDLLSELAEEDMPQERILKVYRSAFLQALVAVGLGVGLEPTTGATVEQVESGQAAIPAWIEVGQ